MTVRASLGALIVLAGCSSPPPAPIHHGRDHHDHRDHHAHDAAGSVEGSDPTERALDEVAKIHGAAGPWAVAGYRMAEHALLKLHLPRGSFDLEIVHRTPKQVQYSCIADGAAAYSGASVGKLNLSLLDALPENVATVYRNKKTGESISLRPTASFRARFFDAKSDHPRSLGREVMTMPAEQVFEAF